jgi:hypothetical protein
MKRQFMIVVIPSVLILFFVGLYLGSHSLSGVKLASSTPLTVQDRLQTNGSLTWNKSFSQDGNGLWQNASDGYYTSGCLVLLFDDLSQAANAYKTGIFSPYRVPWLGTDKSTGQGVWLLTVEGLNSPCAQDALKTFGRAHN